MISGRVYRKTGDLKKARRNLVVVFYLCSLACMVPLFFTKDLKLLAFSLSAAFFFAEMTIGPMWSIPMDIAPRYSGSASGIMNTGSAFAAILSPVIFEVMRQKKLLAREIELLPPGSGFLLIEFGDDDIEAAHRKADKFVAWIDTQPDKPQAKIFRDPAQVPAVWKVRESGNGGSTVIPGEPSVTHEGWEDAAVHPRTLGAYLRELQKTTRSLRTEGVVLRPRCASIPPLHPRGREFGHPIRRERQWRTWGRQARAFLYPKMFGPELCEAFAKFKRLWDPNGKMNPRKLIDSYEPEENLKLGADYHVPHRHTHFHFPDDQGSLDKTRLSWIDAQVLTWPILT
jgi:hypothetical protein